MVEGEIETMKAVGFQEPGPIDRPDSLLNIVLPKPKAVGGDLLVKITAVSVNPVDAKWRSKATPDVPISQYVVLGYDAVGVIEEMGEDCDSNRFKVGDRVYYAGNIQRPGTNSEYHLVDHRIVGHAPTTLSDAQGAALPLTTITAWEMLFDRLKVKDGPPQGSDIILVIGGAGGVGSITIQLLRAIMPEMTIIATASRIETIEFVTKLGAHHVINHRRPLAPQVKELGLNEPPGLVFCTTQLEQHLSNIAELIAPQGRLGVIDDPPSGLDVMPFKLKSVSVHWELMFSRPMFNAPDVAEQGKLLDEVAALVDQGKIQTTLTEVAGKIDADVLKKVHAHIESGKALGKIVLEGFW